MTGRNGGRRRGRAPLIVLLVGLLLATPMVAWGSWTSQDTLRTTATAGAVQAPTGLQCERVGGGLLQTAARVSWAAVPSAGTTYEVQIDDGTEVSVTTTTDASVTLDRGLLSNLLVGLLELLLGGGVVEVSVVAVEPSGWRSPPSSESVRVTGNLLGVYCA